MSGVKNILVQLILIIAFSSLQVDGWSQQFNFKTREVSNTVNGSTIDSASSTPLLLFTVTEKEYNQYTTYIADWRKNNKFITANAFIKAEVNHKYPLMIDTAYTYKIAYRFKGFNNQSGNQGQRHIDTLVISYNPDSLTSYQDVFIKKYSNIFKIDSLTILNIYDITNANAAPILISLSSANNINWNFKVEATIETQVYVLGDDNTSQNFYGHSVPLYTFHQVPAGTNNLEVWCNLKSTGINSAAKATPANFELEWTYIDNYGRDSGTTIPAKNLSYNFRNNSTRVWLDSNSFRIPIIYEQGYIVYRYRMVRPDSSNFQYPIYTEWTIATDSGSLASLDTSGTTQVYKVPNAHLNDSLNWQYTISFAEQGKYKHVLSYYDGLLKNRQTITRFNANQDKLIVTENVYDFEGRPAIKILPTPVNSPLFIYQNGVSTNHYTSLPYKAADFDTLNRDTCQVEVIPAPLKNSALASIYYSSTNPDQAGYQKFVPDAEGYPFVQTIFDPVDARRVQVQGGAGAALQVGNNHYTRNIYTGADQPNLNQLYGIDIGDQGFYKKVVTKDPNGQVSMSIIDYKGRPVTSSLIGTGPDSLHHAIVPNTNIPGVTSFSQELIRGQQQIIVDNSISLERSFYMDVSGNSNLKYVYTFQPMPVKWCPNSYLSIDASYYYYITDKCGKVVFSEQNTLGTVGVVSSQNPISSSQTTPVFLEDGEHTVKKVLTVDKSNALAAVDSFMKQRASCLITVDSFIVREFATLQLPCPTAYDDPCARKKRQMMDDLYPGTGKYGSYNFFDTSLFSFYSATYGKNSIFAYMEPEGQRYQDTCLHLQDTMTINGKFYQEISKMSPKSFIKIFNDSIAEQLLPLHPEWCNLLNCYVDTFKEVLLTLPDGVMAESQGLLYLQDIIAQDPIAERMQFLPLNLHPDTVVKYLSTIQNNLYIDSLLFPLTYCNCPDSVMYKKCRNKIFAYQIDNSILINDNVKNCYFEKMVQLYVQNRQRFVDAMRASSNSSFCDTCPVQRIDTIVGIPIFQNTFSANGKTIDTNSIWYSLDGDTSLKSTIDAINKLLEQSIDSFLKYEDSARILYDSTYYLLNTVQVDSIVSRFANCIKGDTTLLNNIKDSLNSLWQQGMVTEGNYQPHHIRYVLETNGVTFDDLCNPYIINYDPLPQQVKTDKTKNCKGTSFYNGIKNFLNRYEVLNVLSKPGISTRTIVLDAVHNDFESQMLDSINSGSDTVQVTAAYDAGDNLYTLYVHKGTDSLLIYLRGSSTASLSACQNIFDGYIGIGETIEFTSIKCISDLQSSSGCSYINSLAFGAEVTKTNGCNLSSVCSMLGWIEQIETVSSGNRQLAGAIPCTQIRTLYQEFEDTLQVYGIVGVDHPSYDDMLRSFMNYRLNTTYTDYQYLRFIESCALSDSSELDQYVAYSSLKFTDTTDALSFISAYHAVNSSVSLSDPYMEVNGTTGEVLMLIDFNEIPKYIRWQYKDFITNSTVPTSKLINQPLSNWLASDVLGYAVVPQHAWSSVDNYVNVSTTDDAIFGTGVGIDFEIDAPKKVYVMFGGVWQQYKVYDIIDVASGGATPSQKSVALYNASTFLYNNGYANIVWNNLQSNIDEDYFSANKTSFLNYTYSAQASSTPRVLDSLSEDSLNVNVYTLTSSSYNNLSNPGNKTDLYVLEGNGSLVDTLTYLLENIVSNNLSRNGDSSIFLSETDSAFLNQVGSPGYADDVHAYRCADGDYLYVYFNSQLHMYYAFVDMPLYIPKDEQKNYKLIGITILPDYGTTRNFKVRVKHNNTNHILELNGRAGFGLATHETLEDVLLDNPVYAQSQRPDTFDNCEHYKLQSAIRTGIFRHERYLDSVRTSLQDTFLAYLMGNIEEELHVSYLDQKFQITLNYYDRAGNLTTTVPPEGVVKLNQSVFSAVNTARDIDTSYPGLYPNHKKESIYKYNSINQLIHQKTPDGGEVSYYYDAAGRLIFSQNDKQKEDGAYTYNLYDKQSRIIETGEIVTGCEYFAPTSTMPSEYSDNCITVINTPYGGAMYYAVPELIMNVRDKTHDVVTGYVHSFDRRDIIETFYDTSITTDSLPTYVSGQENLRRRVSAVKYYHNLAMYDNSHQGYIHAVYYSYDIAGNVKKLVHNFTMLDDYGQRHKRIDYDYDLISGKVNMMSYNRGYADQFYQKYNYDADNRITKVETSRDGYLWQRDAEYQYYQHGPLARLSIGEHRVQGVDYIYTIQGWLKSINSDVRNPLYDAGKDGDTTSVHSADAYAMSLQYFDGDYTSIGADTGILRLPIRNKNLYNGNIARQTTAIMALPDLAGNYTYDQLNRINQTQYDQIFPTYDSLVGINDYYNSFQYDQDGNLLYLKRRGNGTGSTIGGVSYLMDSLTYFYSNAENNKLINVKDHAADNYNNDLNYDSTSNTKYIYDAIGNLVTDYIGRQDKITWNLYNKVTSTSSAAQKTYIDFFYDGAGNRIAKNVRQTADTVFTEEGDFYVRDALGNILAVYRNELRYKFVLPDYVHGMNGGIIGMKGVNSFINDFIAPSFGGNGDFSAKMVDMTANNTSWLNAKVATYNVSFFPINNSAIQYNLINNGTDYIVPLFQYNSGAVISDAWKAMFTNGDGAEITNWTSAFFASGAKSQELIELMCMADPSEDLIDYLIEVYGVSNDASCITDAVSITTKISSMSDLAGYLTTAYNNHTTAFDAWLEAIAQSSSIYNHSGYTGSGGSLLTEVPDNINNYGDIDDFHDFLDNWMDANNYLDAYTSATQRASTIYNVDPAAMMIDYGNNVTFDAIDSAVLAMASLTVTNYANAAKGSYPYDRDDIETLSYEQRVNTKNLFYLAEHHMYGSSRLGIKNYWQDQYYYSADYTNSQTSPAITSEKLNEQIPWYSYSLQHVIEKNKTTPYGNPHLSQYTVTNILGQKAYELTNHLGNVQAVVKDKRIHYDLNGDDIVDVYGPSVHAVFDHYPFGMLMPGRYMQDTSNQCVTITHPGLAIGTKDVPLYPNGLIVHPNSGWNGKPVGNDVITITEVENIEYYNLSGTTIGDGMEQLLQLNPSSNHDLILDISAISGDFSAHVSQLVNGNWVQLTSASVSSATQYTLNFTPTTTDVRFQLLRTSSSSTISMEGPTWTEHSGLPKPFTYTICTRPRDNYRFGFNGMEKDNEMKGVGNSLDFGARIYDSRLGRWMSIDPLFAKYSNETPFGFAGNNPILYVDKKGLTKVTYYVIKIGQTGNCLILKTTSSGLKSQSHMSYYGGLRNYDWYDYTEINVRTLNADGSLSPPDITYKLGAFRTNVVLNPSETYAINKVLLLGLNPVKDNSIRDGWIMTTSSKLFPGNDHHLNATGRGETFNIDDIASAFGAAGAANTIQGPETVKELLIYAKDAINGSGAVIGEGIINVEYPQSQGKKFDQCDGCGAYGSDGVILRDTTGLGIKKENTTKENVKDFHGKNN